MKNGATISTAVMMRNAIVSLRPSAECSGAAMVSLATAMSGRPSEQAGRADQQHDRHDDEDHRVGRLGKEHLGEALDNTEAEAGDDGAHDRAHAADHHQGEHLVDEIGSHYRVYGVDQRLHTAGD